MIMYHYVIDVQDIKINNTVLELVEEYISCLRQLIHYADSVMSEINKRIN